MVWLEFVKFLVYSLAIVLIVKYILVKILRRLAESLNLTSKVVGNVAGISTSIPELLTICFSASSGLIGASIYNVISSNIINMIQYVGSVLLNKNGKMLKNKFVSSNLILVVITIFLPILVSFFHIESNLLLVPVFLFLAILFYRINIKVHNTYAIGMNLLDEQEIEEEKKKIKNKKIVMVRYAIYLFLTSILLYFVGDRLSVSLENLCNLFGISQVVVGILLGFITSLPELITFFEAQKHHNQLEQKEEGMIEATNNLLTSNILNLFVIQAIGIVLFHFLS